MINLKNSWSTIKNIFQNLSHLIEITFFFVVKVESTPVAAVETAPAEVEVTPAPEATKVAFELSDCLI